MKAKPQRRYPRRPIAPAIEGKFVVTNITYEWDPLRSFRIELASHGPVDVKRWPSRHVNIVEAS